MAKSMLSGGESYDTLIVGVDPGSRPGVALIGDGRVLIAETVGSPEQVADEIGRLLKVFAHHHMIARVGHGDRTNRNRIIRAIWNSVDDIEVVDEKNTTRRTEEPDADAGRDHSTIDRISDAIPTGGFAHPWRESGTSSESAASRAVAA